MSETSDTRRLPKLDSKTGNLTLQGLNLGTVLAVLVFGHGWIEDQLASAAETQETVIELRGDIEALKTGLDHALAQEPRLPPGLADRIDVIEAAIVDVPVDTKGRLEDLESAVYELRGCIADPSRCRGDD